MWGKTQEAGVAVGAEEGMCGHVGWETHYSQGWMGHSGSGHNRENRTRGQSCIIEKINKCCMKKKAKERKYKEFIYMTSSSRQGENTS
jgi:hypothetical protein